VLVEERGGDSELFQMDSEEFLECCVEFESFVARETREVVNVPAFDRVDLCHQQDESSATHQ
jgi:hypothetical protein